MILLFYTPLEVVVSVTWVWLSFYAGQVLFVCLFLLWVCVNVAQASVLGGENLTETIPPTDWPVGKSMGIILIGN